MSSVAARLLHELKALDVVVEPDGADLKINAPKGLLTTALRERIRAHKQAILRMLNTPNQICDANNRPDRPTRPPRRCGACSRTRFWRHAGRTDWVCCTCHPPSSPDTVAEEWGTDPPTAQPADWGSRVGPLVIWYLGSGQHLIPAEPFALTSWITVINPMCFREALLFDISCGPDGPRNRYGAVEDDLRRLHDKFNSSHERNEE